MAAKVLLGCGITKRGCRSISNHKKAQIKTVGGGWVEWKVGVCMCLWCEVVYYAHGIGACIVWGSW